MKSLNGITLFSLFLLIGNNSVGAAETRFQKLTACQGLEASEALAELDGKLVELASLESTAQNSMNFFRESCNAYLRNPVQTLSAVRDVNYATTYAVQSYQAYAEALTAAEGLSQQAILAITALRMQACKQRLKSVNVEVRAMYSKVRSQAQRLQCER